VDFCPHRHSVFRRLGLSLLRPTHEALYGGRPPKLQQDAYGVWSAGRFQGLPNAMEVSIHSRPMIKAN